MKPRCVFSYFSVVMAAVGTISIADTAFGGTDPAAFLNVGVGGRAMGMGGAFVSLSDDPAAVYWNPAGLGRVNKKSIMAMGQSLASAKWESLKDITPSYQFVGVTFPLNTLRLPVINNTSSTLGVGFISSSLDDISYTTVDETGVIVRDTFGDTENAYFLSYGLPIIDREGTLYIGASLKYITQQFTKIAGAQATGYDIDLGMIYASGNLNLGLVMQRGAQMSWANGHKDTGPLTTRFGASNRFPLSNAFLGRSLSLLGSCDIMQRQGQPLFLNAGTELASEKKKLATGVGIDGLYLRMGIDSYAVENRYGNQDQINNQLNLTAGFGIDTSVMGYNLRLDYVFGSYRLGDKNRFSVYFYF